MTARVSRVVYGVKTRRKFNDKNPEHQERAHKKYVDAAGEEKLREGFDVILGKVLTSLITLFNGILISRLSTCRILKSLNQKNFASKASGQRVLTGESQKSYQLIYGRIGESWKNQSGWMSILVRFTISWCFDCSSFLSPKRSELYETL